MNILIKDISRIICKKYFVILTFLKGNMEKEHSVFVMETLIPEISTKECKKSIFLEVKPFLENVDMVLIFVKMDRFIKEYLLMESNICCGYIKFNFNNLRKSGFGRETFPNGAEYIGFYRNSE